MPTIYTDEYCGKVSGAKSICLVFSGRKCKLDSSTVVFNDTELQSSQYAVHLDHHISSNDKDNLVSDAIPSFWRSYDVYKCKWLIFGPVAVFCKVQAIQAMLLFI